MDIQQKQQHDLFFDLDAFDPKWQLHYPTILEAARAAKVLIMYTNWIQTDEGRRYKALLQDVPDTVAQNEAERSMRERMADLAL